MFRHITMLIIAILLLLFSSACQPDSGSIFHAPENLKFQQVGRFIEGPTRITWPDRELIFYSLEPNAQEFMLVDFIGDRSIEYILRNGRLEETRFSLPDGSLVRFDMVGFQDSGSEVIVYHTTPSSNAFYEMSSLPKNLADSIDGFNSRFAHWSNRNSGILHKGEDGEGVPYEKILKSVCCGTEML